ncbi:hypothetical protein ACFVT9_13970 [Kitasatospora cineracea]|uniref:hypothetical protein n=1 Tax=Kitasatospora cineracea TaxID=88074 RepID=UPI00367D4987
MDFEELERELPAAVTLQEAYRAAFYMVEQYISLEKNPDEGLILLLHYLNSDPARWEDWLLSVQRGLKDPGTVDPHR